MCAVYRLGGNKREREKPQEKVADYIFLVETRPRWKIQLIA